MDGPKFESLTTVAQQRLGVQQAQTITAETVASDALARLHGRRGNVSRLVELWKSPETVLQGEASKVAHGRVRELVDGIAIARARGSRAPHTFLPYTPELVTDQDTSRIFRDMGVPVVEALWGGAGSELASAIREVTAGWARHPLARTFSPLCTSRPIPARAGTERSYLRDLLAEPPGAPLADWARGTVAEDWRMWVGASRGMSIDEQLQTFSVLMGLHLHVALQWRLAPEVGPLSFCVSPAAPLGPLVAASINIYQWWQGRTLAVLQEMALEQVDKAALADPDLGERLAPGDPYTLLRWREVPIETARQKDREPFGRRFDAELQRRVNAAAALTLTRDDRRELVRDALLHPFASTAEKLKDYLRQTGRAAAYVGPDTRYSRKRYQVDARLLGLLARLHTERPPESVLSDEEERRSIEAFLDDIFARYGILVVRGREAIEERLAAPAARPLLRFLPNQAATEANRHDVEHLLEGLRLLRRYSDASAILVPRR